MKLNAENCNVLNKLLDDSHKALFLCSTSSQILLAQVLVQHLKLKADLIYTVKLSDESCVIHGESWERITFIPQLQIERGGERAWSWRRTKYRLQVLSRILVGFDLPYYNYSCIYLCNDVDNTIQILAKKLAKQKQLVYFDDGLSWIAGQLIKDKRTDNWVVKQIRRALSIPDITMRDQGKFGLAYVFGESRLSNSLIDFGGIVTAQRDYISKLAHSAVSGLEFPKNVDYLVLTQPLTEDKLCKTPNAEVHILDRYVKSLPENSKILIKLHPRENIEKYKSILNSHSGVEFIKSHHIPYELFHAYIKPKNLVGYFSASLFLSGYFYPCNVLSLVKCIELEGGNHLEIMNSFFNNNNNLEFVIQ